MAPLPAGCGWYFKGPLFHLVHCLKYNSVLMTWKETLTVFLRTQLWNENHYIYWIMNAGPLSKRPLHFHGKKRAGSERRRENDVRKCLVWSSGICDACCSHWVQQNLYMLYTSEKSGHLAIKSQKTPGTFLFCLY